MGGNVLKRYSCYESQVKVFIQICPEFSSQWSSQNYFFVLFFEILGKLTIFSHFAFKNFKFTIVRYGEIKNEKKNCKYPENV